MAAVFVTGPTGVLGRATIPHLLAAGHQVRALSRSAASDAAIRALGAEPVRASLFDRESLIPALIGADAVMHLATRIPSSAQIRRREAWNENDRIRAQGAKNLVDAALQTGVHTFVYPSFAFVYPDSGDTWIDAATTPVQPIDSMRSTIAAEQEALRFATSPLPDGTQRRGVALRLGALYGAGLPSSDEQINLARRGISVFGAARAAYMPTLWIDDAAGALLTALDRAPSGIYDVVDDEPLRQSELTTALAAAVGKRRLLTLPTWAIRLLTGPTGDALSRSLRLSNRHFREATGWRPSVPNAREGLARLAASHPAAPTPELPTAVRAGLWFMALFGILAGLWQQFRPRSFYDDFPGFGMHWVSVDGPYNEHLLRDLGGASLGLGIVAGYALARPSTGLIRTVAAAFLVSQVPHFVYHAFHLDLLATPLDRVLQTATLLLTLLVPLLVLLKSGAITPNLDPARPPTTQTDTIGEVQPLLRSRRTAPAGD